MLVQHPVVSGHLVVGPHGPLFTTIKIRCGVNLLDPGGGQSRLSLDQSGSGGSPTVAPYPPARRSEPITRRSHKHRLGMA